MGLDYPQNGRHHLNMNQTWFQSRFPKFEYPNPPSIGLWLQIQVVGEDCQFLYISAMALSSLIFSHAFHFCLLSWAYQVPLGASVRATETEPDLANPSDLVLVQIADPQLGMLNMYTKPSDWSKEELMLQTLADKALAMKPQQIDLIQVGLPNVLTCSPLRFIHDLGNLQFVNIAGVYQ